MGIAGGKGQGTEGGPGAGVEVEGRGYLGWLNSMINFESSEQEVARKEPKIMKGELPLNIVSSPKAKGEVPQVHTPRTGPVPADDPDGSVNNLASPARTDPVRTVDVLFELENIANVTLRETGIFCSSTTYLDRIDILQPEHVKKAKKRVCICI